MNACVIEATARNQKHLQVRHAYDAIPEATQLNKRTSVVYGPITWLHNA